MKQLMYTSARALPPTAMPHLTTRVEPDLKSRFRSAAKARMLSESDYLRALALGAIGEPGAKEQPAAPAGQTATIDRITVRIPSFLMDAAKRRARKQGMAPSRWIAALVQSNLTADPVMTGAELAVLQASARELAAIGRNLNQIAKAINAKIPDDKAMPAEMLTALGAAIKENRAAIRALVRASQGVWEAGQ
jgi:hypothetical protein